MICSPDESVHVCHKGYLSIFPMLLGLLPPDSPHLGAILDTVHDPEHLWSPYGLRSLSLSHPEFGKGENYWKGPIWIQMNYLALQSLYKVGPEPYMRCGDCNEVDMHRRMRRKRVPTSSAHRRSIVSCGGMSWITSSR